MQPAWWTFSATTPACWGLTSKRLPSPPNTESRWSVLWKRQDLKWSKCRERGETEKVERINFTWTFYPAEKRWRRKTFLITLNLPFLTSFLHLLRPSTFSLFFCSLMFAFPRAARPQLEICCARWWAASSFVSKEKARDEEPPRDPFKLLLQLAMGKWDWKDNYEFPIGFYRFSLAAHKSINV